MSRIAPEILPVVTSLRKNSPIASSFCGLKCAPAGISKIPSAIADGAAASVSSAPHIRARNTTPEFIVPSPKSRRSVTAGSIGTRAAQFSHCLAVQSGAVVGEAAEDDSGDRRRRGERICRRRNRDSRGTVGRETVDAGGDGRKGNRRKAMGLAEFDGAAIARGQRRVLALAAAVPDRTDGVN